MFSAFSGLTGDEVVCVADEADSIGRRGVTLSTFLARQGFGGSDFIQVLKNLHSLFDYQKLLAVSPDSKLNCTKSCVPPTITMNAGSGFFEWSRIAFSICKDWLRNATTVALLPSPLPLFFNGSDVLQFVDINFLNPWYLLWFLVAVTVTSAYTAICLRAFPGRKQSGMALPHVHLQQLALLSGCSHFWINGFSSSRCFFCGSQARGHVLVLTDCNCDRLTVIHLALTLLFFAELSGSVSATCNHICIRRLRIMIMIDSISSRQSLQYILVYRIDIFILSARTLGSAALAACSWLQ